MRLGLGLALSLPVAAISAAPPSDAGPAFTEGAIGDWSAANYTATPRPGIPNSKSVAPMSANMRNFPRQMLSVGQAGTVVVTENYAAGPDGKMRATRLVCSGSWGHRDGNAITLPAGNYTIGLDVRTESDTLGFKIYAYGAQTNSASGVLTATTDWQRFSHTFTLTSSASIQLFWVYHDGVPTPGTLQIDNRTLVPGSVDPGAETGNGHIYFGTSAVATSSMPTVVDNAFDMAGKTAIFSFFDDTGTPDLSVTVALAKTGSISAAGIGLISAGGLNSNYNPTFLLENTNTEPMARMAGNAETTQLKGLWRRTGEPMKVVTMIRQGALFFVYVNGCLCGTGNTAGTTASKMRDFFIGAYSATCDYKIGRMILYPFALTAAQANDDCLAMRAYGASLTPAWTMADRKIVVFQGDSVMSPSLGSPAYQWSLNTTKTDYYGSNRATSGQGLTGIISLESATDAILPADRELSFKSAYLPYIGTNNLGGPIDVTAYANQLGAHVQGRKAAGYTKVGVATLLDREQTYYTANRATFNGIVRDAGWRASYGIDFLVDFAAIPEIGGDGAWSNATYFNGDHTHPTGAATALMGLRMVSDMDPSL